MPPYRARVELNISPRVTNCKTPLAANFPQIGSLFRASAARNEELNQSAVEADAVSPLLALTGGPLEHILLMLRDMKGGTVIRCTCRRLRSAFDACNPRLVLGGKQEIDSATGLVQTLKLERVVELLTNGPCTSLCIQPWWRGVTMSDLMDAAGSQLKLRLQSVVLKDCILLSLSPLSACSVLQHLDVSGCSNIVDLAPLASCPALRHIDLRTCPGVEDQGPLASCRALQQLHLKYCGKVQDLGPLASCTALQQLDLHGCNDVEDLRPLESCTALQELDLFHMLHGTAAA